MSSLLDKEIQRSGDKVTVCSENDVCEVIVKIISIEGSTYRGCMYVRQHKVTGRSFP